MKAISYLILFLILSFSTTAQTVLNFNWELDATQKIVITYDLLQEMGNSKYYEITFFAELGNDTILPKRSNYRGDSGPMVEVGRAKKIVWNVKKDYPTLSGNLKIKLKVKAINPSHPIVSYVEPKKENRKSKVDWLSFTSSITSGLGLLWLGYQSEKEAAKLYDIYGENRDPNLNVYDKMSRDGHFASAKIKRKKGVALMAAGGTALTIGSAILIKQIVRNKKNRLSMNPIFSQIYDPQTGGSIGQAQLSLNYKF